SSSGNRGDTDASPRLVPLWPVAAGHRLRAEHRVADREPGPTGRVAQRRRFIVEGRLGRRRGPRQRPPGVGFRWFGPAASGHRGVLWWAPVFPDGTAFLGGGNATVLRYSGQNFERLHTPGVAKQAVYGVCGSAVDDVWAVGSFGGRDGFVWHFDGTAWTNLPI